jgi:putative transposase
MAVKVQSSYEVSIRIACRAFAISGTCYRYQPKLSDENAEIADWLLPMKNVFLNRLYCHG